MDSFTLNKIAMAFLACVLGIMGVSILSETIFHSEMPEKPGYAIAAATGDSDQGEAKEDKGPQYDPVTPLLAAADAEAGAKVFKKCASCHTTENGGADKTGPNLWNIVDRRIGSVDGFKYSKPMAEYGQDKNWSYEELNGFLWKPRAFLPKTKMGFAGIKKVKERADLILYLRSLSDNPAALPGS